jgi:phage baseplate assembly protein W
MTIDPARFGIDLRLLPALGVPRSDRDGGSDLQVGPGTAGSDLTRVVGVDCLTQALILRILTPLGALSPLGHPDYGCRLGELIGELNTEAVRGRAKVFVLQALAGEPRITRVLRLDVVTSPADRTALEIRAQLQTGDGVLNLVVPFSLAGGMS